MSKKEQEHDTLGNRQKSYEELSTSRRLMPNCPIYARIDGRAFHTFCDGLKKPYSKAFIQAMQDTCKHLVKETTAVLGYVQSDEISLGWTDTQHCPFDGRVQKLESVLASMASAYFVKHLHHDAPRIFGPKRSDYDTEGEYTKAMDDYTLFANDNETMRCRSIFNPPCFDCRVFNVPSMEELANAFLWRENDAIKNSISGMSLHFYSHKELQGKNSDEKIHMMRMKGYCFYEDTEEAFLRGTFWQRENYLKELSKEEVDKIPENQRSNLVHDEETDLTGAIRGETWACWRSRIAKKDIPYRLTDIENKVDVLFNGREAVLNKENPTLNLAKKGVAQ